MAEGIGYGPMANSSNNARTQQARAAQQNAATERNSAPQQRSEPRETAQARQTQARPQQDVQVSISGRSEPAQSDTYENPQGRSARRS